MDAIHDAAAILGLTRWPQFSEIPKLISRLDFSPVIIDRRRQLNR